MTHKPNFRFAADLTTATITLRRDFAAPRKTVWDCYSKPELLDRWFAPSPLTTRTKHMEFREGGYWHFAMIDPSGAEYWSRQEYVRIDPIESFTARDSFTDETGVPNPDLPGANMTMTFTDKGQITEVHSLVSYASPEALQQVIDMGMEQGIAATFDKLDVLLKEVRR